MWKKDYPILFERSAKVSFKKMYKVSDEVSDIHLMEIKDLHKLRRTVVDSMQRHLDFATKEGKDYNSQEEAGYNFADAVTSCINDEVDLRKALGNTDPVDPEIHAGNNTPVTSLPSAIENEHDRSADKPTEIRAYENMFPNITLTSGGFKGRNVMERFRDYLRAVNSGRADTRLLDNEQEARVHSESVGTGGGFSLTPEVSSMLMNRSLLQAEIVRPRATVIPLKGRSVEVPYFDDSDEQNSAIFGGFNVLYYAEGGTLTRTQSKLKMLEMTAKKIGLLTDFTNELLEDSLQFSQWVSNKMVLAIGAVQDRDYISGNGVGKPLGLINCPNRITISRAGAGAVALADLQGMVGRLHPAFHEKAVWIISASSRVSIMGLSDTSGHLVYTQSPQSIVAGLPATIYGFPVIWSTRSPALGSEGDVILTDLSAYGVAMRNDIRVEASNAPQFTSDKTDLRVIMRIDGQSLYSKAITPITGDETLSSIVTLGT